MPHESKCPTLLTVRLLICIRVFRPGRPDGPYLAHTSPLQLNRSGVSKFPALKEVNHARPAGTVRVVVSKRNNPAADDKQAQPATLLRGCARALNG